MTTMKLAEYGTYRILDSGRRVPRSVVNILAPGMYKLLKEIEWTSIEYSGISGPRVKCPCCRVWYWDDVDVVPHHNLDCKLYLLLNTIENWDQDKFTLSWADYLELKEILGKVENNEQVD